MAYRGRLRKGIEWRERLARFARAGTSIVEFCLDEGVSTPSFYAWRKRLAGNGGNSEQAEEVAALGKRHGLFAPVRVTGAVPGGSHVTVWLRGGTCLEIPLGDASAAGTVLGAIVQADAAQADAARAGGRPC
jgi:hypothetical protein